MADISQVKLPNGDTYNLVDETSGYITGAKYVKIIEPDEGDTYTCSDTYSNIKAALDSQQPIKAFFEESDGCTFELLLYATYLNNSNDYISFVKNNISNYGVSSIIFSLTPQNTITIQTRGLSVYDGTVE